MAAGSKGGGLSRCGLGQGPTCTAPSQWPNHTQTPQGHTGSLVRPMFSHSDCYSVSGLWAAGLCRGPPATCWTCVHIRGCTSALPTPQPPNSAVGASCVCGVLISTPAPSHVMPVAPPSYDTTCPLGSGTSGVSHDCSLGVLFGL